MWCGDQREASHIPRGCVGENSTYFFVCVCGCVFPWMLYQFLKELHGFGSSLFSGNFLAVFPCGLIRIQLEDLSMSLSTMRISHLLS